MFLDFVEESAQAILLSRGCHGHSLSHASTRLLHHIGLLLLHHVWLLLHHWIGAAAHLALTCTRLLHHHVHLHHHLLHLLLHLLDHGVAALRLLTTLEAHLLHARLHLHHLLLHHLHLVTALRWCADTCAAHHRLPHRLTHRLGLRGRRRHKLMEWIVHVLNLRLHQTRLEATLVWNESTRRRLSDRLVHWLLGLGWRAKHIV